MGREAVVWKMQAEGSSDTLVMISRLHGFASENTVKFGSEYNY
jgi:hypothetical protein